MSGNMDKWNDDPRLTAFALGELEPAEAEEIARAVEADPALQRLVEEIRGSATLLAQAFEEEEAPRLEEAQRARIVEAPAGRTPPASALSEAIAPAGRFTPPKTGPDASVVRPRRWRWAAAVVGAGVAASALALVGTATMRQQPVTATMAMKESPKFLAPPPHPVTATPVTRAENGHYYEQLLSADPSPELDPGAPVARARSRRPGWVDPSTGYAPMVALNAPTEEPNSTEQYAFVQTSGLTETAVEPRTTFSIDVDTASYSNVRRFIEGGRLPPPNAVRVEEMINYFDYDLPPPQDGTPVAIHVDVTDAPWDGKHLLARVALKGKVVSRGARPAAHLVFLIDVSGSMSGPTRLPLVKESLGLLLEQLEPRDTIAIVTYAGGAGLLLAPTPLRDKPKIRQAINALSAGGGTNGSGGIQLAYRVARDAFEKEAINRVILATDGDFNVGISDRGELERLIAAEATSGVFLTVLGYGMDNLNDATLETLADKGNGHYAYVDRLAEAKKVLVDEASSTLVTIAKDVKVQLEFNPARIKSYRLVGYENRRLENRDFSDDKKDAGERGAGHAVTMLYELVPAEGEEEKLRYQRAPTPEAASDELFFVRVRYKEPSEDRSALVERAVRAAAGHFRGGAEDLRFATAVAAFGLKLRGAQETEGLRYQTLAEWADGARKYDPLGRRAELVGLIRRAAELAGEQRGAKDRGEGGLTREQLVRQALAVKDPKERARLLAVLSEAGSNPEALEHLQAAVRDALLREAAGHTSLPEQLADEVVLRTLRAHRSDVDNCRSTAEPALEGVVTVSFLVRGDGRVSAVKVSPDRFKGTRLEACLRATVQAWTFGKFSGRPMPVDFPLTLRR